MIFTARIVKTCLLITIRMLHINIWKRQQVPDHVHTACRAGNHQRGPAELKIEFEEKKNRFFKNFSVEKSWKIEEISNFARQI